MKHWRLNSKFVIVTVARATDGFWILLLFFVMFCFFILKWDMGLLALPWFMSGKSAPRARVPTTNLLRFKPTEIGRLKTSSLQTSTQRAMICCCLLAKVCNSRIITRNLRDCQQAGFTLPHYVLASVLFFFNFFHFGFPLQYSFISCHMQMSNFFSFYFYVLFYFKLYIFSLSFSFCGFF